jgi:hypothetical protein
MAAALSVPGFDGLMALSRREGVDIRPTLLRVLTDLYVQTPAHSEEEEQHYIALASRLIEEVDDATRAMVRARLAIYPRTPPVLARQLDLAAAAPAPRPATESPAADMAAAPREPDSHEPAAQASDSREPAPQQPELHEPELHEPEFQEPEFQEPGPMLPAHAAQLSEMFFAADRAQRLMILRRLDAAPLPRAARVTPARPDRAVETLEQAAFIGDRAIFALELGNALMLPSRLAERIVADPGGEPLTCAAKALAMPQQVFERILLFLDARRGASVAEVYRLARLYPVLTEHAATVLIAALRGAMLTTTPRPRHAPHLYDDDHTRARAAAPMARPAPLSGGARKAAAAPRASDR